MFATFLELLGEAMSRNVWKEFSKFLSNVYDLRWSGRDQQAPLFEI